MEKVRLEIEFVTPCFLGGADANEAEPGVLPEPVWNAKAIRGQLRWWFRAVAGGRFKGDLAKVHDAEARIFGSTKRASGLRIRALGNPAPSNDTGMFKTPYCLYSSAIASRWKDHEDKTVERLKVWHPKKPGEEVQTSPIAYLAFGPYSEQQLKREYISPTETADLHLWSTRPLPINADEKETLQHAIWCWFNLGGLGARSRKGFGSLRCDPLETPTPAWFPDALSPASIEEFESVVEEIRAFTTLPGGSPTGHWSYFSSASQVYIATQGRGKWEEAMVDVGAWTIGFRRRYGGRHDLRFSNGRDYNWVYRSGSATNIPDRSGFGLPLGFSSKMHSPKTWFVFWGADNSTRRASPLLAHILKIAGKYYPVFTHLPAGFLPANERLLFTKNGSSATISEAQETIVFRFLDDLADARQPVPKNLIRRIA